MNKKALGFAVAVALMSTSALAVSPYGNSQQKGSLLVFPRIDVSHGRDTLILITNDYSGEVNVKCYYQSTDGSDITKKWRTDFQFRLTQNHPAHFWASTGQSIGDSVFKQNVARMQDWANSTDYSSSAKPPEAGELKCWATNAAGTAEIHHNHLVGMATVVDRAQAYSYNAIAFQALVGGNASENTGNVIGTDHTLLLDGKMYDKCAYQAVGQFRPTGQHDFEWYNGLTVADRGTSYNAQVTLVACDQDLRQDYKPPLTKVTYEFWNQDEVKFTGTHQCIDSWYERDLSYFPEARYTALKTESAYFRATGVQSSLCDKIGPTAGRGLMGVLVQSQSAFSPWDSVQADGKPFGDIRLHGLTLNARGSIDGSIKYDYSLGNPGDIVKK